MSAAILYHVQGIRKHFLRKISIKKGIFIFECFWRHPEELKCAGCGSVRLDHVSAPAVTLTGRDDERFRLRFLHGCSECVHHCDRHVDIRTRNETAGDLDRRFALSKRRGHEQTTEKLARNISRNDRFSAGDAARTQEDRGTVVPKFTLDRNSELTQSADKVSKRTLSHAFYAVEPEITVRIGIHRSQKTDRRAAVSTEKLRRAGVLEAVSSPHPDRCGFRIVIEHHAHFSQGIHHHLRVLAVQCSLKDGLSVGKRRDRKRSVRDTLRPRRRDLRTNGRNGLNGDGIRVGLHVKCS